ASGVASVPRRAALAARGRQAAVTPGAPLPSRPCRRQCDAPHADSLDPSTVRRESLCFPSNLTNPHHPRTSKRVTRVVGTSVPAQRERSLYPRTDVTSGRFFRRSCRPSVDGTFHVLLRSHRIHVQYTPPALTT